jgi:predicted acyltransferase
VVRRSVIIFLLGLVVNGFPFGLLWDVPFSWSSLRIPGVLQRIAICYAVSSLFVLRWDGVRDRLLAIGGLLAAYWLAMLLVPVPGYGPGVLDPEGNLCRFIDMRVLGSHTWEFAPAEGFDPEGILSTIPAIATTLFGTLAGSWLRSGRAPSRTATGFAAAGVVLVLGGALADIWFPINKNLWTSSYVLFTAGCASVAFALLYWVVDVLGWQRWSHPFRVFGSNALSVFVGSELLATLLWIVPVSVAGQEGLTLHDFLYGRYFFPLGSPPVVSLIFAIVFVVFLYMFAWVFWKRRWIIKI